MRCGAPALPAATGCWSTLRPWQRTGRLQSPGGSTGRSKTTRCPNCLRRRRSARRRPVGFAPEAGVRPIPAVLQRMLYEESPSKISRTAIGCRHERALRARNRLAHTSSLAIRSEPRGRTRRTTAVRRPGRQLSTRSGSSHRRADRRKAATQDDPSPRNAIARAMRREASRESNQSASQIASFKVIPGASASTKAPRSASPIGCPAFQAPRDGCRNTTPVVLDVRTRHGSILLQSQVNSPGD